MLKKVTSLALAAVLATGIFVSTAERADAQRRGAVAAGVALGVLGGLAIAGAAGSARASSACYLGPRECHWTGRTCYYNRFGDYVCRGGQYVCHRPTICP